MVLHYFKRSFLYLFVLLLFINCSEDEPGIPENAVSVPQTELISLTGDSNQLELVWKPVVIQNFIGYKVYRLEWHTDESLSPYSVVYLGELVHQGNDHLASSYIDDEVPFNAFVHYAVVTEYTNLENDLNSATSVNLLSYENESASFAITSVEKATDGSLKVTWEKDTNPGFENYIITAFSSSYASSIEEVLSEGQIIEVQNDQQENTSQDHTQHPRNLVNYVVSKVVNGKTILSKNFVSMENPRSLNFRPAQTLKNTYQENEMIIINPEGELYFYNLNSLERTKVAIEGSIFFCSIGQFNGVADLYVPSNDGKVYIIDLVSHQIKQTIDLDTEHDITSVIAINDHLLFLEKHPVADIGGMFVYNRASNTVLNRDGIYSMSSNSKLVHAKENYFFSLWNDALEYGSDCAIRKLNINGNQVTINMTFDESKFDSRLFALSEDKSFYVSSAFGYQSTVNYPGITEVTTGRYADSPAYGDVKIIGNNQIYLSVPDHSRIDVFQKDNFASPMHQYPTTGQPLFIEVFGSKIHAVNQYEENYFIETITQ